MFDQGGTAFHPVAVIAVDNPAYCALLGVVNMSADHTVNLLFAGFVGHGLFIICNVLHGVLNFML